MHDPDPCDSWKCTSHIISVPSCAGLSSFWADWKNDVKCVAMRDSLALPTYAHERPDMEVRRSKSGTLCVCEYSTAELVEKYGAELQAAGRGRHDEGVERPVAKVLAERGEGADE